MGAIDDRNEPEPLMTSDRKNGLVSLHGCALGVISVIVFIGWWRLVEAAGWIHLVRTVSLSFYVLAVVAASILVYQGLGAVSNRLGDMSWTESVRFARHQVLRFMAVLFTFAFVSKDGEVSRAFLVSYILMMAPIFAAANIVFPKLIIRFFMRNMRMRTVILATPADADAVGNWIKSRGFLGIEVIGWMGAADDACRESVRALRHLGAVQDLRRVLLEQDVGQVVISQSVFSAEEGRALASCAEEYGCRVRFFENVRSYFGEQPVCIEHEGAFTFATFLSEPLDNPLNRLMKRIFDIGVSLPIVAFVLPPLALAVWLMQRLQSPGPLLHNQQRSGLNRRRFLIYKFRTMHVATSAAALANQAQKNDSRVYPFGRFLRRTSLDEFPQFLNVLLGSMSVSGPRPHLIEHDEQFARVVNAYYIRQFVKPGITGLAQSKGFRGEISEAALLHKRIGYDLIYIRRWTLGLDFRIILETVRQLFSPPKTAY
jgi:exopolysaccharide biosynthesis polyprenyl glycosylphosphotransferase